MSLSDHEQRVLDDIERDLHASDPKLATSLVEHHPRLHMPRAFTVPIGGIVAAHRVGPLTSSDFRLLSASWATPFAVILFAGSEMMLLDDEEALMAGDIEPPDRLADSRDRIADQRDREADQRDHVAERRDRTADRRDHAAELRDDDATHRDEAAEESGQQVGSVVTREALEHSANDRRDSATDRRQARGDRGAGASERFDAERDRHTSRTDRAAAARERDDAPSPE